MLGNESADIVGGKDFSQSRYWLTRSQATDGHDKAPRFVQCSVSDQAIGPGMWRWAQKSLDCGKNVTFSELARRPERT